MKSAWNYNNENHNIYLAVVGGVAQEEEEEDGTASLLIQIWIAISSLVAIPFLSCPLPCHEF